MAFVVVGFAVYTREQNSKGLWMREKQVSARFTCKSAAEDWCELAKKGPFPDAYVREIMKHDNI